MEQEQVQPQRLFEEENQSQEQDNVIGGVKFAYDFLTEIFGHFNSNHPLGHLGYAKGANPDIADIIECMEQYSDSHIQPFKDRIQSLEAANAFHKKAAEEAIQEQWRLIKENEELKEKVNELTMADMTHEYNESEAENFRPHFEEQMCVGFAEWITEYYCYSYEEKFWASLDDLLIEERLTTEQLYKLYKSKP